MSKTMEISVSYQLRTKVEMEEYWKDKINRMWISGTATPERGWIGKLIHEVIFNGTVCVFYHSGNLWATESAQSVLDNGVEKMETHWLHPYEMADRLWKSDNPEILRYFYHKEDNRFVYFLRQGNPSEIIGHAIVEVEVNQAHKVKKCMEEAFREILPQVPFPVKTRIASSWGE